MKFCRITIENLITWIAGFFILFASGVVAYKIFLNFNESPLVSVAYAACFLIFLYGNLFYVLCRHGYLRRMQLYKPSSDNELQTIYNENAETVTFLLPSYKEDLRVIRQSLLSAAMQDYPNRRVVLLIDDPPNPINQQDKEALMATKQLVEEIQETFKTSCSKFQSEYDALLQRALLGHRDLEAEKKRLCSLYQEAIAWFDTQSEQYPLEDHTDKTFVRLTFLERASHLRLRLEIINSSRTLQIEHEYYRLACLFKVHISSFERKRYVNLSHASNKAMNLNSYIGLMGKHWAERMTPEGLTIVEVQENEAKFHIPDASYVAMLDADSILTFNYALKLIHVMDQPSNKKIAIIQTPYSAFPNPTELLEKIAGATTDIGYNVHQGLSYYNATFWVGANAIARKKALEEISEIGMERGFKITRFIQDRTVIEDTESTIDLVMQGWKLHNYPERLSYSATPPDFGSLLIQRRRWANGGLLILPKLLCYVFCKQWSCRKFIEGFFRFYYLFSISGIILALSILCILPMQEEDITIWMMLSAIPYFAVYARDLKAQGYSYSDLLRVVALNLVLIPINAAGVVKSLQQAITGKNSPFCRTPKIQGRTLVPAFYVVLEWVLLSYFFWETINIHAHILALVHILLFVVPFGYAIVKYLGLSESFLDVLPVFPRLLSILRQKWLPTH